MCLPSPIPIPKTDIYSKGVARLSVMISAVASSGAVP
jgi:hypothetical protein